MKKISDIQNPYLQKNAALADRKENGGNKNGYVDNNEILLFSSLSMDMLKKRSILEEYQEVVGIEFDSPEISSQIEKLKAELKTLNYSVSDIKSTRLEIIAKKADLLRNGGNGDNKLDYDEALLFAQEALPYLNDEENLKEFKKILKIPSDEEIMKMMEEINSKSSYIISCDNNSKTKHYNPGLALARGLSKVATTGAMVGLGMATLALL